jgi:hypothetical protein
MKKFILKILMMMTLLTGSLLALIIFIPSDTNPNNFFCASIDKYALLRKNVEGPRIILVGGSNLALGVDSPLMEERLHRPVINMGLHAGLGLKFMINEVKPFIKANDVVLIIPEYDYFLVPGAGFGQGTTIISLINVNSQALWYINSWDQFRQVVADLPTFIKLKLSILRTYGIDRLSSRGRLIENASVFSPEAQSLYQRANFNANGDLIIPPTMEAPGFGDGYGALPSVIQKKMIRYLNDFYSYAKKRQVTVIFIFPSFAEHDYTINKKQIDSLYQTLKNELYIPILSSPEESVFPDPLFFDTTYHLNPWGKRIRTEKVIFDLAHSPYYPQE